MENTKDIFAANSDTASTRTTKRVVMIVFDGVGILDATGPARVIGKAKVMAPGTMNS